jgi:hypothetical protein
MQYIILPCVIFNHDHQQANISNTNKQAGIYYAACPGGGGCCLPIAYAKIGIRVSKKL